MNTFQALIQDYLNATYHTHTHLLSLNVHPETLKQNLPWPTKATNEPYTLTELLQSGNPDHKNLAASFLQYQIMYNQA